MIGTLFVCVFRNHWFTMTPFGTRLWYKAVLEKINQSNKSAKEQMFATCCYIPTNHSFECTGVQAQYNSVPTLGQRALAHSHRKKTYRRTVSKFVKPNRMKHT